MTSKQKIFDYVYLINLKERTNKYQQSVKIINDFGIAKNILHFPAIKPTLPGLSSQKKGRIGCLLSHIAILQDALEKQAKNILVLEDDILPLLENSEFKALWKKICHNFPADWQLIYFGGNIDDCFCHTPIKYYNEFFDRVYGCFTTHAIAYRFDVIEYLTGLDIASDPIGWINKYEAIDVFYAQYIQKQFPSYISKPMMIGQMPGRSDIENMDYDYNPMMVEKFQYYSQRSQSKLVPILDSNVSPLSFRKRLKIADHVIETFKLRHFNDVSSFDEIVITDNFIGRDQIQKLKRSFDKKISAWLVEPKSINPHIYKFVTSNCGLFSQIYSHDKELFEKVPNFVYVPVGDCWIEEKDRGVHFKTKNISFLSSSKLLTEGHVLRKEVANSFRFSFDKFQYGGEWSKPIDFLRDYRFSVVIENSKVKGYFTEKIINCFKTGTIPIYYGDPDITSHFDDAGILAFNSTDELKQIIKNCNQDNYELRFQSVINNYHLANKYSCLISNLINNLSTNYGYFQT